MHIAFYTPFKPLGHPSPSGDLVIATGLCRFLRKQGHTIHPVGPLRARWIYWQPWRWPLVLRQYRRTLRQITRNPPDLWLTYHTYYKAPDLLGPSITRKTGIPYLIFQGIYSTKRRKRIKTWPGFHLNRHALRAARHVFTNRRLDLVNLKRLLPDRKLSCIAPGIYPEEFPFDPAARTELRRKWHLGDRPVILSAAMFRPDVKTEGLIWTLQSCGRLFRRGLAFDLVIAGDGKERDRLKRLADREIPGCVRFVGKIPRQDMHRFYSAGDLFVFPGIRESLGMVFLESQCCGLPVVAFDNGGIPEVVRQGETGLLVPLFDADAFDQAVERLILDRAARIRMGRTAAEYVRQHHDLNRNYREMEQVLCRYGKGSQQ